MPCSHLGVVYVTAKVVRGVEVNLQLLKLVRESQSWRVDVKCGGVLSSTM